MKKLEDMSKAKLILLVKKQDQELRYLKHTVNHRTYLNILESLDQEKRFRTRLEEQLSPVLKRLKQYQLLVGDIDVKEFYD